MYREILNIDEEIINKKIESVLEGGDILKVKDDRTFKILFNSLDKKALSWFMSQILEKPINEIKNVIKEKNTILKPLNRNDKGKYLDFFVEVGNDLVIVELNNNNSGLDYTRNLYYTFHALLNQIPIGSKYRHIHAMLVNLNWFSENYSNIKPIDVIEYPYPMIGKESKESIITVKNINLSYFDKIVYNGIEMKDFLWKLFTINSSLEIDDIKENIKELKDYCNELKRISESREYCMFVWDERMDLAFSKDYERGRDEGYEEGKALGIKEGILEGKKEGILEGRKEGILEGKKEVVINLYKNGISKDVIAKSSGLNISYIDDIIKSCK